LAIRHERTIRGGQATLTGAQLLRPNLPQPCDPLTRDQGA